MRFLVHLEQAFAYGGGIAADPDVSGHFAGIGEKEEGPAGKGRVDDVHAGSAKNLFGEYYAYGDAKGRHPVGDCGWHDEDEEDSGDEEAFGNFVAADAGKECFPESSDDIREQGEGQDDDEAFFKDGDPAVVFADEGD